jgi:hypothetical protein
MKLSRLEDLLRTRPPDERLFDAPHVSDVANTLPVRSRPRPVTVPQLFGLASAAIVVVAITLVGARVISRVPVAASPSANSPSTNTPQLAGVIPWLAALPDPPATPEPTPQAAALPPCAAEDLVLVASGWGGATGSMAGGAMLINLGVACRIESRLSAQLSDANGVVIATGAGTQIEPALPPVAIASGGEVGAIVVWMNWCGPAPKRPLTLSLEIPAERARTRLSATVADDGGGAGVPRCDTDGAGSSVGTVEFRPPEPSGGGYAPEPCAPDALSAYSGGWGAAAGTSYTRLVILNRGSFDCMLPTSPTVELHDAGSKLLALTPPWPREPATVFLPPGWTAVTHIAFADWCTDPPALPMAMDLRLAGATFKVSQPASEQARIPVPPCMSTPGSQAATFALDAPFGVVGVPISEPDPIDTLPVRVTISPLPPATPGSTLEFTVTLTNITPYDKPLNLLALCPGYTESVSLPNRSGTVTETYELNCAAAGTLQPRSALTFAMRVGIPTDAEVGTAGLVWQLGERGPADKTTFEVVPSSGWPPVLSLENRGGPTLVIGINGSEVAKVECNDTSTLTPGEGAVPQLPWALTIVRQTDAAPVFAGQITALPQWYLQIGGTSLGLGSTPPIGPAVSCPPSG